MKSSRKLSEDLWDRVVFTLVAVDVALEALVPAHQPEYEQSKLLEPLNRELGLIGFRLTRIPRYGRCQYCKATVPATCNCCASCSDEHGP